MGEKIFLAFSAALALYWNYRFFCLAWSVFKVIFGCVSRFTPRWLIDCRNRRQEKKRIQDQERLEAEKAQVRLAHYEYREDRFVNIGFIEEDRRRLFKGHDIKWKYGRKNIDPKTFTREESHRILYWMFTEMAAYRFVFTEAKTLWTNEMEIIWREILPRKFKGKVSESDFFERQAKKAESDFDSDQPVKIVC